MNFSSVSSSKREQQLSRVSITSVPRNVTCYLISGHHLLNILLDLHIELQQLPGAKKLHKLRLKNTL